VKAVGERIQSRRGRGRMSLAQGQVGHKPGGPAGRDEGGRGGKGRGSGNLAP